MYGKTLTPKSHIIADLTNSNSFCDSIYVNISIPYFSKSLIVGTYYRHNSKSKFNTVNFIEYLDKHLCDKKLKNKHVIIAGDMNLDLIKIDTDNDIEAYFNTFLGNGYKTHINSPTRTQYKPNSLMVHSATIIDHIFSNMLHFTCTAGNMSYPDSDHYANFVSVAGFLNQAAVRRQNNKHASSPTYSRNLKNINIDNLNTDFDKIDWCFVYNNTTDLHTATSNLIQHITELCDTHAPLKKVSKCKTNYVYKPWIDKQLLTSIRLKNNMFKKKEKISNRRKR